MSPQVTPSAPRKTSKRPRLPGLSKPRRNVRRNVRVATVKAKRQQTGQHIRSSLRGVLVLLLVCACGWGGVQGYQAMLDNGFFAVKQIEISGTARISEAQVLARLDLPEGADLPDLDLTTISASVLSHPWIERATVRRTYPNTIAIQVWERTPSALLTESAKGKPVQFLMVDRSGVILGQPTADAVDLPRLTGIPINGLTAGDRVSAKRIEIGMLVALAYHGNTPLVDVADIGDPLLLVDGMRIRLGGRGSYRWRLERLKALGPELNKLAGKHGAEVDLRYPDRVVARPL